MDRVARIQPVGSPSLRPHERQIERGAEGGVAAPAHVGKNIEITRPCLEPTAVIRRIADVEVFHRPLIHGVIPESHIRLMIQIPGVRTEPADLGAEIRHGFDFAFIGGVTDDQIKVIDTRESAALEAQIRHDAVFGVRDPRAAGGAAGHGIAQGLKIDIDLVLPSGSQGVIGAHPSAEGKVPSLQPLVPVQPVGLGTIGQDHDPAGLVIVADPFADSRFSVAVDLDKGVSAHPFGHIMAKVQENPVILAVGRDDIGHADVLITPFAVAGEIHGDALGVEGIFRVETILNRGRQEPVINQIQMRGAVLDLGQIYSLGTAAEGGVVPIAVRLFDLGRRDADGRNIRPADDPALAEFIIFFRGDIPS